MKKLFIILIGFAMSASLIAQEKTKEVSIVFSSFNGFGVAYKTGSDNSLWRFNTLYTNGYNEDLVADSSSRERSSMRFDARIGKEFRKVIADKLEFRYGADLSFKYYQSKTEDNNITVNRYNERLNERITYEPGINLVLGLNYMFNDNFAVGAEMLPNFSYITGTSIEKNYYTNSDYNYDIKSDISGFRYGLSNTSILLSLTYRL